MSTYSTISNKSIHSAILYAEDNLMPLAYHYMHEPKENKEYHAFLLLLTYFTKYSHVTWHIHDGYLPFSVLVFLLSNVTDKTLPVLAMN